ncbi:TonB-dependent receptor [Bordetella holmesii]|nr:TonB-dependent receptor [Bordetella holmesii]UEB22145.1 TonB-dependent receptor [Bordetella holmesii]
MRLALLLLPLPTLGQTSTLAPIVVTGTRNGTSVLDTPASVDVIDGATLRANALQVNLSENLSAVPGLQIPNRQNFAQDLQLSIRGFGARSTFGVRGVRIYVDGIPATMPDGQGQTSNIDISSADRVEVLRGPYSALYGNSSGGVVQVFTEDGARPPHVQTSMAAGSFNTLRYGVQASGASGTGASDLDYVVGINRFTSDGYRDHSGARKNLANAKLGLQLDDDSRLTLVLNRVDLKAQDPMGLTRQEFDDDPRAASPAAQRFNTRKTVLQTQGGLVYERQVDADNALRVMVYYGQRETWQYQSIPVAVQSPPAQSGGVIGLRRDYGGADVRWTSHMTLAGQPFTVVGGLAYDSLHEIRKGYENFTRGGATLGTKGALRRDETNEVYNLDPYLQTSWEFLPRWTLDTGLRYSSVDFDSRDHYIVAGNGDDSGDARYRRALPVATLRYALDDDSNVYVSFGKGFETPTMNEISYRPDGQPGLNFGLQPSVSTNLEAGIKRRFPTGLATAAVFHTRTENEIVSAGSIDGRSAFRNGGRTRRDGLELAWDGEFGSHWRTRLAYTYINARYRDDVAGTGIAAGNTIPGIARQALYAALAWAPPQGWQAGIEGRYLDKLYVDDANSDAAAGYVVAALSAGYIWKHGPWTWSTYARVDNLFDRRYAGSVIVNEGNGRYFEPAPGRNWSAGLTATYRF